MGSADHQLIQIVDAAMAEAVRKGGPWIACRPGCCECCIGVFPISQTDAQRLREGLRELQHSDPERAARVSDRARQHAARYTPDFPGDPATGILSTDPDSQTRFEAFGDDDPCPALDPKTGTCDLYPWRPITCRTFGPSIRLNGDSVDVCELCYQGATDEQILAVQVELNIAGVDGAGEDNQTIVAFALRDE
ncbi:MAG TPA: YkgJ family cysteine cluster protein [Bryobacteraceae bacterium]|jgi:Fe-S-cluster containining protein